VAENKQTKTNKKNHKQLLKNTKNKSSIKAMGALCGSEPEFEEDSEADVKPILDKPNYSRSRIRDKILLKVILLGNAK